MAGDAPTTWGTQPGSRDVRERGGRQLKTYLVDKSICERRVCPPKCSHTLNNHPCHSPEPCGATRFGGRAIPWDSAGGKAGGRAAGGVAGGICGALSGGQLEDQDWPQAGRGLCWHPWVPLSGETGLVPWRDRRSWKTRMCTYGMVTATGARSSHVSCSWRPLARLRALPRRGWRDARGRGTASILSSPHAGTTTQHIVPSEPAKAW